MPPPPRSLIAIGPRGTNDLTACRRIRERFWGELERQLGAELADLEGLPIENVNPIVWEMVQVLVKVMRAELVYRKMVEVECDA